MILTVKGALRLGEFGAVVAVLVGWRLGWDGGLWGYMRGGGGGRCRGHNLTLRRRNLK